MARNPNTGALVIDNASEAEVESINAESGAQDGSTPAEPAKKARQNRNTYTMPITLPTPLHEMLVTRAAADGTSATHIARRLLADYVSYTLPLMVVRAPKRKFATKEDAVAFRKDRNARAKALLAALDSGEIDEAVLAKFLAAQSVMSNGGAPAAVAEQEAVPA